MKKFKLNELFYKPISGEWGVDLDEGDEGVGVIRTTNFGNDGRLIKLSEIVNRCIDNKKVDNKKLCVGDIIIEKSGGSPAQPVGRVVYYDIEEGVNLCNNFTSILRAKEGVYSKYILYIMLGLYLRGVTRGFQNKTTGIINLKLERYLDSVEIPLPSLPIQEKIVEVLDKAQELIDLRKKQLGLLDDLVQSVFYEMFGDPVTNPKGWDIKKLCDVTSKITDGVHNKPDYTESGVPFISVKDISSGRLNFDDCKFISEKDHMKYIGRCKPERGDILYTKVGARYGIPAIVDTEREFSLYVSAALIKPNRNQINSMFLRESLRMPFIHRQAVSSIKGIGVPDLHLIEIKKFDIIIPPILEQEKFEHVVGKIEDQRCMMQFSLTQMENTFNSLMQQAFSGELFQE